MKATMLVCAAVCGGGLIGETADEAYARLTAYRSVWETNAVAYARSICLAKDLDAAAANGMWFVDAMSFPDVTETNRLDSILQAKEEIMRQGYIEGSIQSNTNCWYALADFIARLKTTVDPRWQEEDENRPFFDFNNYRQECLEAHMRQYTNRVSKADAVKAFNRVWHSMFAAKWNREVNLHSALRHAKQMMRDRFWLFGAKDLPADVKNACRSNIVERARLTADEERYIFDEVPDWYYKVMGIKRK